MFVAFVPNYSIYGVGKTKEEALSDARTWSDTLDGLEVAKASQELVDAVEEEGGEVAYIEKGGVMVLDKD